jgi:hypothetical protein
VTFHVQRRAVPGDAGVAAQGFADVLARGDDDALGYWVAADATWSIHDARLFWQRHVRRRDGASLAHAGFAALRRRCSGMQPREFVEVDDRAFISFGPREAYGSAGLFMTVTVRDGLVVCVREHRRREDALRDLGLAATGPPGH